MSTSTTDFEMTQGEAVEIDRAAKAVKAKAEGAHAQYPQYAGHWDGAEWIAVRIKRNVTTKMGLAFEAGEITIAKQPFRYGLYFGDFYTAYSVKNEIDTSVHFSDIEVL